MPLKNGRNETSGNYCHVGYVLPTEYHMVFLRVLCAFAVKIEV